MKALVIVASGLHLGSIGCYGNEWVETPALDRLAAEGVVFDQHYADQPDAAGAQRAWQTGCYRFPAVNEQDELTLPVAVSLFPILAEQGPANFLVSDDRNHILTSIPVGWQHASLIEPAAIKGGLPQQMLDALAKVLICLPPSTPWLLRFDLAVLLPPWNTPEEFRDRYTSPREEEGDNPLSVSADPTHCEPEEIEALAYSDLQNRYAAAVTYLDTGIGQVLHELEQCGLLEDMLVVVTSDGGLKLGEAAMRRGPQRSLHEELIHIPLILRLPGKAEAGRRVFTLTQSVDLLPTVFEAFGVPLPAVHGHSLLPLAQGKTHHIRAYACAALRTDDNTVEWALRSPDWYFLLPVSSSSSDLPLESELYVKPDDRWEVNNVRQHHLDLIERLEQTLRSFVEATRRPGPLRPPELPHLEPETAKQ